MSIILKDLLNKIKDVPTVYEPEVVFVKEVYEKLEKIVGKPRYKIYKKIL